MDIINISKTKKTATVSLSADELVKLCNVLYHATDKDKNNLYNQIYSNMMIARDLCQYGHIDDFCLERIVKCRGIDCIKELLEQETTEV